MTAKLGMHGRLMLKWNLKKQGGGAWSGFILSRVGTSDGLYVRTVTKTSGSTKYRTLHCWVTYVFLLQGMFWCCEPLLLRKSFFVVCGYHISANHIIWSLVCMHWLLILKHTACYRTEHCMHHLPVHFAV